MNIRGEMLIEGRAAMGQGEIFFAYDPTNQARLEPGFGSATPADVERACALAGQAFVKLRTEPVMRRAELLELIAGNLEQIGEALIARAMSETGLPVARLQGELGRTTAQLRMFADLLRDSHFPGVQTDPALPSRIPPKPSLTMKHIAVGPVAVFGASNFPLAFSVAGGDTASALAAGCPVIVKAHPAHPGTSELAGQAIADAVKALGLPAGTFALLFDAGHEVGQAIVGNRHVQAVGFTGSRKGGLALLALAQARSQPIPVYAEMSAINPVALLPEALAEHGDRIGQAFATAMTMGVGQFCTSPGLLLAVDDAGLSSFCRAAVKAIEEAPAATMLTPGIHAAFREGIARLEAISGVESIARGSKGAGLQGQPHLFSTSSQRFLAEPGLREEVFGPAALLVRCRDLSDMADVLDAAGGQLTISVHAAAQDREAVSALMITMERNAGRIVYNGFGTGVEVSAAMVHGGPFPATSDSRSTAVGASAIWRFMRPVCYQDIPTDLLGV